jgi:integrase
MLEAASRASPLLPEVIMKLRLDAKTIAGMTLAKGRDEEFAWDTELEGFGLRLRRRHDGGLLRTWAAQYRINGRTRRVTLGALEKLTPAQAREGARQILARATLGQDPQAERQANRQQAARTFRAVVEAYLAARQSELRPSSFRQVKRCLTGSYFRPLHARGIDTISRSDLAAQFSAITHNHSAASAAYARRLVSTLFRWAMEEGWIASNPVIGTRQPAIAKARDRVLTDSELCAVWRACDDGDYGCIVRLLILLGSRRQEVGGMCWSEFDLTAGTWTLPAERSKNGRGQTIALPAAALAIITTVPRSNRDSLFGTRAESGFMRWATAKADLDRRLADTVKPWRLHDIRRSVATKMADVGVEPHHIEAILNHYSGHRSGIAGVYNRSPYERAVKAALARWSEHVLALLEGRSRENVIPLHA